MYMYMYFAAPDGCVHIHVSCIDVGKMEDSLSSALDYGIGIGVSIGDGCPPNVVVIHRSVYHTERKNRTIHISVI